MTDLEANSLKELLKGKIIGSNLWVFPEITSTNDWLKDFVLRNDTPSGALVIADYQTKGRGRMRRIWICPPGVGIMFSVYWIPRLSISSWPAYTMAAAMAVFDLFTKDIPQPKGPSGIRYKWPNDIYVAGKKISGILAETATARGIVMGIGLNALQNQSQLPDENSTSIAIWSKQQLDRSKILTQLTTKLEQRFLQVDQGDVSTLLDEIKAISPKEGSNIKVQIGNHILTGTYRGLSPSGMLRLQTKDGLEHELATVDKLIEFE